MVTKKNFTPPVARRFFVGLALLLCACGLPVISAGCGDDKPPPPSPQSMAVPVTTAKVQQGDIPIILNSVGTLRANQIATIAPEIAGTIIELDFSDGQRVEKGTVLVKLDQEVQKAALEAAEADMNQAQFDLKHMDDAYKQGAATITELTQAKNTLAVKKAGVSQAQATLDKLTIRAPFSGKLSMHEHDVGDYIQTGAALVTIVQDDPMLIDFGIAEKYAGELAVGQTVFVSHPEREELQKAIGKVIAVNPNISQSSRSIQVRGKFSNEDGKFISGQFVKIALQVRVEKNRRTIPQESVVVTRTGMAVFVVKEDTAKKHPIKLGRMTEEVVIIEEGPDAGEIVVLMGWQKLRNGSPVMILPSQEDADTGGAVGTGVPPVHAGTTTASTTTKPASQPTSSPAMGNNSKDTEK